MRVKDKVNGRDLFKSFYSCLPSTTVICCIGSSVEQRALFSTCSVGNSSHKKIVKCIHSVEMKSLVMCDAGFPMPTHSNMSPLQGRGGMNKKVTKKDRRKIGFFCWGFLSVFVRGGIVYRSWRWLDDSCYGLLGILYN